ncbi:methylenetetrahydrofolate--tRNA-(uracil(54)-C(5))-methyltransferase (FADH(2)-oxidizing) TrmFO [Pseudodesulfovibrio piezophilus]|uniref:Methylenetetrahydrofolate--tRNA-(uracil-5-)-methyltransferase TrmFO n=1 Tax=Pseudodesulfovibrio piezophilus (strain DSM 21447 / JCM 15486 / C1TLV30) TaxID=1322246 RepID=M1WQC3_PSEP2|nr:methylenetetrahydrofolate--tRNA-(uracil(54)-C(5))-methyltransferase (FADH(2)-oxidizing) TrmFO [Pseudodesulfovibrio piezophilus]CCH47622.1 Methylenetetrahydrofolate--tRNA-(uracil-5-)-methyltransferase TrmFO [Pseudodesulfovibrio piezophilus C1TLV30]
MAKIIIVGGGLAGAECAWQLARTGHRVELFEMKPEKRSEAHMEDGLAELVCSNSFRATGESAAIGLLKEEMTELGSLIMEAAYATRVPAGGALAVDRSLFSAYVTSAINQNENIEVVHKEITTLDSEELRKGDAVIIAAGPLASPSLTTSLMDIVGDERLYFYDAIAPIVSRDSIDFSKAFWGSRWKPEDHDYLNCPMSEEEYKAFVAALLAGEKVKPREFEKVIHFEACLPVEAMAERGEMTLAFGPLKPVGFIDPETGERPFAIVQLRTENKDKTAFNLVGFQTKLTYPDQKKVFRMIPGLEKAEFLRLGSIHRNTYVNAPDVLDSAMQLKARSGIYLTGQITGVEGYLESAASGLWLGISLGKQFNGKPTPKTPPLETALGALLSHLRIKTDKSFQPSNVNFGLMPGLQKKMKKKYRKEAYGIRARASFSQWFSENFVSE